MESYDEISFTKEEIFFMEEGVSPSKSLTVELVSWGGRNVKEEISGQQYAEGGNIP